MMIIFLNLSHHSINPDYWYFHAFRAYPVYTVNDSGSAMYSPTSGQYYQTNNGSPIAYSQVIRVSF